MPNFEKINYQFFVLAADIGASNSHFAVMGVAGKHEFDIVVSHSMATTWIQGIWAILNDIMREAKRRYDIDINRCCIGAAGPVSRKRSYINLTNVDFTVSASDILEKTMLNKVILVNDFEAMGFGLDLIDLKNDVVLLPHVGECMIG